MVIVMDMLRDMTCIEHNGTRARMHCVDVPREPWHVPCRYQSTNAHAQSQTSAIVQVQPLYAVHG